MDYSHQNTQVFWVEFLRSKGKTFQINPLSFLRCPWMYWDELIRNFWTPNSGNCNIPKSIKIEFKQFCHLRCNHLTVTSEHLKVVNIFTRLAWAFCRFLRFIKCKLPTLFYTGILLYFIHVWRKQAFTCVLYVQ